MIKEKAPYHPLLPPFSVTVPNVYETPVLIEGENTPGIAQMKNE